MSDRPGAYQRQQSGPRGRFPGFDVLGQAGHWDPVTAELVRRGWPRRPPVAFFTAAEAACAAALLNLLDRPGR